MWQACQFELLFREVKVFGRDLQLSAMRRPTGKSPLVLT